MLAAKFKLNEREDFKRVEKEGKVFQSNSFGVAVFNRKDKNSSRFGFIVSTKTSPHAFQRNRIKRALSEAVRTNMIYIKDGLDVVFLAKKIAVTISTELLMREAKELLSKKEFAK